MSSIQGPNSQPPQDSLSCENVLGSLQGRVIRVKNESSYRDKYTQQLQNLRVCGETDIKTQLTNVRQLNSSWGAKIRDAILGFFGFESVAKVKELFLQEALADCLQSQVNEAKDKLMDSEEVDENLISGAIKKYKEANQLEDLIALCPILKLSEAAKNKLKAAIPVPKGPVANGLGFQLGKFFLLGDTDAQSLRTPSDKKTVSSLVSKFKNMNKLTELQTVVENSDRIGALQIKREIQFTLLKDEIEKCKHHSVDRQFSYEAEKTLKAIIRAAGQNVYFDEKTRPRLVGNQIQNISSEDKSWLEGVFNNLSPLDKTTCKEIQNLFEGLPSSAKTDYLSGEIAKIIGLKEFSPKMYNSKKNFDLFNRVEGFNNQLLDDKKRRLCDEEIQIVIKGEILDAPGISYSYRDAKNTYLELIRKNSQQTSFGAGELNWLEPLFKDPQNLKVLFEMSDYIELEIIKELASKLPLDHRYRHDLEKNLWERGLL